MVRAGLNPEGVNRKGKPESPTSRDKTTITYMYLNKPRGYLIGYTLPPRPHSVEAFILLTA